MNFLPIVEKEPHNMQITVSALAKTIRGTLVAPVRELRIGATEEIALKREGAFGQLGIINGRLLRWSSLSGGLIVLVKDGGV